MPMARKHQPDEIVILEKHQTFYAVAYTSLLEVKRLTAERAQALQRIDARGKGPSEDERDVLGASDAAEERLAVTTVVFSALALEAFINDYGLTKLPKEDFGHLDRLSPVGKWVMLPWAITGNKLSNTGRAFRLVRELFRRRNHLVHFKSQKKRISKLKPGDRYKQKEAATAVRTVREIVYELNELDKTADTHWITEVEKLPPSEGDSMRQLRALSS